MGNNIKQIRIAKGWDVERAAKAFGLSESGYKKVERSERKLKVERAQKAARIFEVPEIAIIADDFEMAAINELDINTDPKPSPTVPVVGYVGASSVAFFDTADNPNEFVPMPPDGTEDTVAVIVKGDSLGSMFNNWLVYYDDIHSPPRPELLRKLCVVWLDDGRVVVKGLFPGTRLGRYNLVSQTEGMIENVEVKWAALVRAMTPRFRG